MKAGLYGIKNLHRTLVHLPECTREPNADDENLYRMYRQLNNKFSRYIVHVAKYISGRYEDLKSVEQSGPVYTLEPAALQRQALDFLNAQVFQTPEWVLDDKILSRIGVSPLTIIGSLQSDALAPLLNTNTFSKLVVATAVDPHAYSLTDLLSDLHKAIWTELDTRQPISIYRRNLQSLYLEKLLFIVRPFAGGKGNDLSQGARSEQNADVAAVLRAELKEPQRKIRLALPAFQDKMSIYHLQNIAERISTVKEQTK